MDIILDPPNDLFNLCFVDCHLPRYLDILPHSGGMIYLMTLLCPPLFHSQCIVLFCVIFMRGVFVL